MKSKSKDKVYDRWSKTVRNKDTEETFEVEEVENGYIISHRKYETSNWKSIIDKRYISTTNPLKDEDKIDEKKELLEAIKNLEL